MGSSSLLPFGRARLLAFAIVGNVLPVIIATGSGRWMHPALFFVGAVVGCVAPLVVALVPRRRRVLFWSAAFAEIPALTLMQAHTGGAASGYSVLVIMAMVW